METPLRRIRKKKGITLVQLASIVGSDSGNLSRIETGKQIPTKRLIFKLVELFQSEGLTELHIIYPEKFITSEKEQS